MTLNRIIISGGGTGGHIFPALAIANEIKRRYPDADILFVGAEGRMEMQKVPAAGYKIIGLPVMGFPRKPSLKIFAFFKMLLKSTRMARRIVNEFKPDVAVGVGGYASGPILRAAAKMNIPALIQEQNSYAGITNKILGRKVNKICVAYDGMERFFPTEKIVFTGNPVREHLIQPVDRSEALDYFGLEAGKKVILVVGGSLGARSINNAVKINLKKIGASDVQLLWQTGGMYFDRLSRELEGKLPANVQMRKFIDRMDYAYAAADLVVSRAGAGTISELCLVGKASILVPSPNVSEDHQTRNAMALVDKKAALMVKDVDIEQELFSLALSTVTNEVACSELAKNAKSLARPKATAHIVDEVEKLVSNS